VDIDNETSKYNYKYNSIGELVHDSAGGIDTVLWTIYGKPKTIKKHNGDSIVFFYDPFGNRLEKRYYPHSGISDTTKYTREANGSIMAIYDRKKDTVRLDEFEIYGIKRIGSLDTVMRIKKPATGVGSIDSLTTNYLEGQKQYELDNHLGNVLATVSDKKIPIDTVSTDSLAKYYLPVVITASDYYPFGMVEPGRSYLLTGDSAYRFAFNGKEKTNEVYGSADLYDYGMRFYDPRLGRFLSMDPLAPKYPFYTPYSFAGNKPIWAIDVDGLEEAFASDEIHDGTTYRVYTPNPGYTKDDAGKIGFKNSAGQVVKVQASEQDMKAVHKMESDKTYVAAGAGRKSGQYSYERAITKKDADETQKQVEANTPNPNNSAAATTAKPNGTVSGDVGNLGLIYGYSEQSTLAGGNLWRSGFTRNGDIMGGEQTAGLLDKVASEVKQRNDIASITIDIDYSPAQGVPGQGPVLTDNMKQTIQQGLITSVKEYLKQKGVSDKIKVNVNVKIGDKQDNKGTVKVQTQ